MTHSSNNTNKIHELFAYLCVGNANDAIRFYTAAFGAQERFRLAEPSGRIGHAELELGNGIVLMLSDPYPECGIAPPAPASSTSVTIHLHVDNADELIERAVQAGATLERAPQDEFYGERGGVVRDPFGHRWNIGHNIAQVTPEEMQARYTALLWLAKPSGSRSASARLRPFPSIEPMHKPARDEAEDKSTGKDNRQINPCPG